MATWREVVYPQVRPGVDLVLRIDGGEVLVGEVPSSAPDVAASRSAAAASADASQAQLEITFLSYLGGRRSESVSATYLDPDGYLLVVGVTNSPDYPLRNPLLSRLNDPQIPTTYDGFLTKIDLRRREIVFSTYLGGPGEDAVSGVASDETGAIYLVGTTSSADFPLTRGSRFAGGRGDAWIAKLDASGSRVIFGVLHGGNDFDGFANLQYDGRGGLWVAGQSFSSSFPLVSPLFGREIGNGGHRHVVLAKLSAADGAILFSTYFGGYTVPQATALDPQGNFYVTGLAGLPDLPVTPGAVQPFFAGAGSNNLGDAFVTKIAADGSRLLYSTYLGGPGDEYMLAIAVDPEGAAHLGGFSISTLTPLHRPLFSWTDRDQAWLAKLSPDGGSLVYSTFFGGSGGDVVSGAVVDSAGDLWVSGHTTSDDLPLVDPIQGERNDFLFGWGEAFLAKISRDGSELLFSTYFGGSGEDGLGRPLVDFWNGLHTVGRTTSKDLLLVDEFQSTVADEGGISHSELFVMSFEGPPPERPALLLGGGRFRVQLEWTDPYNNGGGVGRPQPLTDDTGYFWFFDEDNVEVIVKVIDGRVLNDHFWVFFGALSTVEYRIGITDTVTGRRRVYSNPPTRLASRADTAAFPDAVPASGAPGLAAGSSVSSFAAGGAGTCPGTELAACLGDGRFEVRVVWRDPRSGDSGQGRLRPLTDDTAAFWFFDPANIELVVKSLDGRDVNGHFWTFYGSLTDVELDLYVHDRFTGAERHYHKPANELASGADTRSF